MNKKEQAEMQALREQLHLSNALRFTETPAGPDVPPPDFAGLSKGFLYHAHGEGRVAPACSSAVSHNFGSNEKTSTQNPRHLYSTKLLALRALRHEMELDCAKRLARIDALIAQEINS